MNITQKINKILFALSQKNKIYKINTNKFYSEKSKKYCTKYIIKKKIIDKYEIDYEGYSKLSVLLYLVNELNEN